MTGNERLRMLEDVLIAAIEGGKDEQVGRAYVVSTIKRAFHTVPPWWFLDEERRARFEALQRARGKT